jgi:hypothetical protein
VGLCINDNSYEHCPETSLETPGMDPHGSPAEPSKTDDSPRDKKALSRVTLIEVLIAIGIIAALVAWLPAEWNK